MSDLLKWVEEQPIFPKVFWHSSLGTRAALGAKKTFSKIPTGVRVYGGCTYDFQPHFWEPAIERSGELNLLPFSCLSRESLELMHTPSQQEWEKQVNSAIAAIDAGHLKKVVLARKTTHRLPSPPNPYDLLRSQLSRNPNTTGFLFHFAPDLAWVGATPETLYRREGRTVTADALAGTRRRGSTPEEDLLLESDLWNSSKDKREFNFVKHFLETALTPYAEKISFLPQDQIKKLSHVQHRHNVCTALLKPGVSDQELIAALHPTPALGGSPRPAAMQFIKDHEPFTRDYYGAPIGFISPESTELAVGIRSAYLRGSEIDLFAGAGIVAGSTPLAEWEELNHKIKQWNL